MGHYYCLTNVWTGKKWKKDEVDDDNDDDDDDDKKQVRKILQNEFFRTFHWFLQK